MQPPRRRAAIVLSVSLFVLAYAAFVWPTPFHYTTFHADSLTTTVRVSRFTGRAEMLMPTGWRRMQ